MTIRTVFRVLHYSKIQIVICQQAVTFKSTFTMPKPKLAYWKIRGLAQPIRLLLHYVGQEFEDIQYEQGEAPDYSRSAWDSVKDTLGLDFPNLPYYIDGDVKLTQSNSILRYIAGKKYTGKPNLLGETDKEKGHVDMILESAMDLRNGVVGIAYNPKYDQLLEDYKKKIPTTMGKFEAWMKNRKFFAGDNVTVADFPMYELLDQHTLMIPNFLDSYPNLKAFHKRFQELPAISKYLKSPECIKRPINNKSASFK